METVKNHSVVRLGRRSRLRHVIKAAKPQISPWILSLLLTGIAATPIGFANFKSLVIAVIGAVLFYSGAVSVLNDYFDRDRDRVNHPDRPIPSGVFTEIEIILLGLAIAFLGVALIFVSIPQDLFLHALPFLVMLGFLSLIYGVYPNLGLWGFGRQIVLGAITMVVVLIGFAIGGGSSIWQIWLAVSLSGAYHFIVFVGKDFADMPGDKKTGLVTIPIALGIKKTGIFYATGIVLVYGILAIAYWQGMLGLKGIPLSFIGACCAGYVSSCYLRGLSDGLYWSKLMFLGFMSSFAFSGGLIIALIFK